MAAAPAGINAADERAPKGREEARRWERMDERLRVRRGGAIVEDGRLCAKRITNGAIG